MVMRLPRTLDSLSPIDKAHWELHLKAAQKDLPDNKEISGFLEGGELPNLKHPADIHDWLEKPERRTEIEALNG